MRSARILRRVLAWLVAAHVAHAAGASAEPSHLSYRAPAGCPGEAEFLEMVARDGGAFDRASDGTPARSIVVSVETSSAVAGRLIVREVDGAEAERAIAGTRCDDVVRTMAVIVALSLGVDTAATPSNSAGTAATPPGPDLAAGVRAGWEVPLPPPLDGLEVPADLTGERRPRWRLGFSFEGSVSTGPTPGVGPGIAQYVELFRETPGTFAPSIRVGGAKVWGATAKLGVNEVDTMVARADGCPWRFLASQPWSTDALGAQLCARVDVGWVDTQGAPGADVIRRAWVATGVLLRLRWSFPESFFEAEGGVDFPLTRYRFSSGGAPDSEVPAVAGTLGFGVGGLFL